MTLLFDQNISFRLVKKLEDLFPSCAQVRDLGLENSSDLEIWKFAKTKGYTIVTFDADFYEYSLVWGHPPKIVWLRLGNSTTSNIEKVLRLHFASLQSFDSDTDLACLCIK
jgi:predicted nuclease of predicted toxin-antitoxin system